MVSYVELLADRRIRLVVHGQKLLGDESQVRQRTVRQHHQHLVGCQPAACCAAPDRRQTVSLVAGLFLFLLRFSWQRRKKRPYLGWKSWLGAGEGVGLELLMMMREARNRKSSSSCWISEGPAGQESHLRNHTLIFSPPETHLEIQRRVALAHPGVPSRCRKATAGF